MTPSANGTATAQSSGFDFAKLETSSSQPIAGSAQIALIGTTASILAQSASGSAGPQIIVTGLTPLRPTNSESSRRNARFSRTVTAQAISGAPSAAMTTFESTVC